MEKNKIKKINVLYMLGYILMPIVLCAICFGISYAFFPKGTGAVILIMVPPTLSVLWWSFGGRYLYKSNFKKFEAELDQRGFVRNHTFTGRECTVVVDVQHGEVALLFFWNPFVHFVVPASRIKRTWVDDGRGGAGFLEGSSRVSFMFLVDDVKVRVNTFTSNKRWRMDSDYILTGISKADMMIEVIEASKAKAE